MDAPGREEDRAWDFLSRSPSDADTQLGELAVERSLITREQLEDCLKSAREEGVGLSETLVRRGFVTSTVLADLMEAQRRRSEGVPDVPRYEVRDRIGSGSAAIVHRAWDRELRRIVAMKVLRQEVGLRPGVADRFLREARVAAGLSHPNIITVHDVGEADRLLYLVTEFIDGRPLSDIMGERSYEMEWMVRLLEKVARGMGAAHEKGIVHRDIKPANVMVTSRGEPKLGDFGVAHVMGAETALTRTGQTVGTPMYMAPEQVTGETRSVSPATDVYGLGAVLYEAITGRPPHTGANVMEVYQKITSEDPSPPRRLAPGAPRDLELVVMKALQKNPSRRYANGTELADDLRRFLEREPVTATPPSPIRAWGRWGKRHPMVLAAAAVAVAIAVWFGVRAGRVSDLRDRALKAEAAGRWQEAMQLWSRLETEGVPEAPLRVRQASLRLQRSADAERRRLLVERIGSAQIEFGGLHGRIRELDEAVRAEERRVEKWEPAENKQTLWKLRGERDEARRRRAQLEARIIGLYGSALQYPDEEDRLAGEFAEFLKRRLEEAERAGDRDRVLHLEETLSQLAGERRLEASVEWLARGGELGIDSDPPGAALFLFRYVEAPDRRLVARPYGGDGDSHQIPGEMSLPRGSYLVILRMEGYPDVRYPVLVGRGTRHVARVRLYTRGEIGEGFVYVPGGTFISGGDPDAHYAAVRNPESRTDDFFLARFEVTVKEYLEFVNDRDFLSRDEAVRHVPHASPERVLWRPVGDRFELPSSWNPSWPVVMVNWEDAQEYCRWLAWKSQKEGRKAKYRLPTSTEWEKAARGVDGRCFPWGNHFDWTFTKGAASREVEAKFEPVGTFTADESPYGIRDLAGNIREWCADRFEESAIFVHARGGAYADPVVYYFRAATRGWFDSGISNADVGFRVLKEPP